MSKEAVKVEGVLEVLKMSVINRSVTDVRHDHRWVLKGKEGCRSG